jgi:predicted HNH restriction endonuclease
MDYVRLEKEIGKDSLDCFCPNCEQFVTMDTDSDSYAPTTPDGDEIWWDNYVCPVCKEIFDKSYGNSDGIKLILAYNKTRLK